MSRIAGGRAYRARVLIRVLAFVMPLAALFPPLWRGLRFAPVLCRRVFLMYVTSLLLQYIRTLYPTIRASSLRRLLALSGWDEAFINGHVADQRLVFWQPLFHHGFKSGPAPLSPIKGYVAVVCLTDQLRVTQDAAQCRDRVEGDFCERRHELRQLGAFQSSPKRSEDMATWQMRRATQMPYRVLGCGKRPER